jgi:predicted transcriptional regulator
MIAALKQFLPELERWPDQDQQALLEAAREIEAARTGVYVLTPEEEASISPSLAQADRGEFATDEEVRAIWAKHGL